MHTSGPHRNCWELKPEFKTDAVAAAALGEGGGTSGGGAAAGEGGAAEGEDAK